MFVFSLHTNKNKRDQFTYPATCVMKLKNCLNKQNSSRIVVAENDEIRSHAREFYERISEEENVQSSFKIKKRLKSLVLDSTQS